MRRGELGESLNLRVELIADGRPNRSGVSISPTKVTIHNTSNTGVGANAAAHSKWVRNTGYYTLPSGKKNWVSWHFTVDDTEVIRHLPLGEKGWHAGSAEGNATSIGVEVCMHSGIDQAAAFDRAARLVATLLYDLNLSIADVVTHRKWTGKNCPVLLLAGGHEADKWAQFKGQIQHYLEGMRSESGAANDGADAEMTCAVKCDEPPTTATPPG